MTIVQAILLGIIEGLTEFLPISSTGHLIVAQELIGYKDVAEIFTVVIQIGAITAVVWFYRQDLAHKFYGLVKKESGAVRFWQNLLLATLPAGLVGLFIESRMEVLVALPIIAIALIVGGLVIWLIETFHRPKKSPTSPQLQDITNKQALQVGLYQIMALVPGVSRSGATIMGGLLSGLDRVTATAFSFYLSIPILVLASAFKLIRNPEKIPMVSGGLTAIIIGMISAFVTAFLVIKWLLQYVSRHDFKPFAYYRIAVGSILLLAFFVI